MNKEDFQLYQKLLLENSGLSLTQDKSYLLTTRLQPVAQSLGLNNLAELTEMLRKNPAARTTALVVQAMATNETSFFRDMKPFVHLKKNIFPALVNSNSATKTVRIWSAGCSTGQEPYSIAMVAREFFRVFPDWTVQIVATDIAEDVLAYAKEGVYSHFEIQRGLSMKLMLENFSMENTQWRIHDDLKRMVKFGVFNLLSPMEVMGKFDVIFCRNVLIYFDIKTKKSVLNRLSHRLQQDGYLLLGACESAIGIDTNLRLTVEMPGVYVLDLLVNPHLDVHPQAPKPN